MTSVSNSSEFSKFSKFSVKSQQVIAAQVCQIAKMRKLLIAAGIDPDAQVADPSLGPVISVEVKVNTAVQFTVAEAHVMYVRHARYRSYVRSMKVKGATQVKDQNCQEVVAGEVVMGKVAPNTLFALVQGIKAIRDSSQVGYPVLDAVLAVAPEVLVARVARLVLAQAMFQVQAEGPTLINPVVLVAPMASVAAVVTPVVSVVLVRRVSLVRSRFKYKFKIRLKWKKK